MASNQDGLVPLIVGVTGHRDLVDSELDSIGEQVRLLLLGLRERFPDRPLEVLSPLAEGADRLVAEIALDLDLRLSVALPMSRELYALEFITEESKRQFHDLCDRAQAVYELPLVGTCRPEQLAAPGPGRDLQYAQLGVFLCAHSHIVLALWDGKASDEVGSTAQVVRFHHDDVMAGMTSTELLNRQLLVNDESDLVYHIVVSRARPNGAPAEGLLPAQSFWLTSDTEMPRTEELPERYTRLFERTSEFNREARRFAERIARECSPLIGAVSEKVLPDETHRIDAYFCVADWLAIHYHRRVTWVWRITHSLALIMGVTFIVYSELLTRDVFIEIFFACFVVAFLLSSLTTRRDWQGKYLEYRALAEGLRVQFYWAAAGVTGEMSTKYSHDSFLQKQDPQLGWIRNVMRVAGIGCDVAPNLDPEGLSFAIREWVGSADSGGQLRYYWRRASMFVTRGARLRSLAQVAGFGATGLVVVSAIVDSDRLQNLLFFALAILLLIYSVHQSFAHRVAESDLIKQYRFMYSIFDNARRRLIAAASDAERRSIMRVLGQSAMDEHAEWIFLHRDRMQDPSSLLRMEL